MGFRRLIALLLLAISAFGQESPQPTPSRSPQGAPAPKASQSTMDAPKPESGFTGLLKRFGEDQKQIWTSPSRVRFSDTFWLVPAGGITAGLFVTDRQYSASLSTSTSTISHYKTISNAGIAGLVGAGAGMYLFSFPTHNEHWRETGFLAGEAALNSLLVVEAMKYSLGRQRPYQGTGQGSFFQGGTSFPSEHSAAAWSIAGVIAHEYPGVLPSLFAYGTAGLIDYARVKGRQHFPSDVFVGSIMGFLIAQSVYHRHHDPSISVAGWTRIAEDDDEKSRSPSFMGSPYVPLDSWIYPALERMAALGYVRTGSLGLRPWTRLECARQVAEASERGADSDAPAIVQDLQAKLSEEFSPEFGLMSGERNLNAQFESAYLRFTGISGTPLTDNLHFGQTILNDFGRPYQEGFNAISGTSGWAAAGPFVFYARGEYEHAPSAPAPSQAVLNFISTADSLPLNAPQNPITSVNRFRLLDAYVAMNLANWQLSYGKQSQWWGASAAGPMLFTNNVEPLTNMFRIDRVKPFQLPWIFSLLGKIRLQAFLGQQSGIEFLTTTFTGQPIKTVGQYGRDLYPQTFLTGEKISFRFTENLEFNIGKTTVYGGPGNPLTLKTFFDATTGRHVHGDVLGDGRSGVDFSYRVPKLRNWLSFYGDAFNEDEISPLGYPRKAAFMGGLYFTHMPAVPKLDLRMEGGTTSPVDFPECNGCFYSNLQYVNGYTNDRQLIGSWVGRAAQGETLQSNYWFSPKNKVGVEVRHRKVDSIFLPGGGTQNDVAVNWDFFLKSGLRLSGTLQYEKWAMPLMNANPQSNVTISFQVGYWPTGRLFR